MTTMRFYRYSILLMAGALLMITLSCSLFGSPQATTAPEDQASVSTTGPSVPASPTSPPDSQSPEAAPENPASPVQPTEAAPASPTPPAEAASQPSNACPDAVCIQDGTFLLERPIGPDGRNTIDTSSRYGTLNKRTRLMYHGVQFLNSTGTPVLAAADGVVAVAGDDIQVAYGLQPNTYGNLVILQHSLPGIAEPVYTLYAHLSQISVKADETVQSGQQIGQVGMTGSVFGSTLYFEVRVGENSYDAARNPELWLALLPDAEGAPTGALAGRVVDAQGEYQAVSNVLVEPVQKSVQRLIKQLYLKTYLERDMQGLSPWEEGFAASNLPEGSYQISFWFNSKLYERVVEVQPGLLTFITFQVK